MTLSELFLAAIKYLPEEEFLCHAINKASEAAMRENLIGESEFRRLGKLRNQAKQIVMAQIKGYHALDSWMRDRIGIEYYRVEEHDRKKKLLNARKRWARRLAKQHK